MFGPQSGGVGCEECQELCVPCGIVRGGEIRDRNAEIYRVIQSSGTVLKEVVVTVIRSKKCTQSSFGFATVSDLLRFYVYVASGIVIVDFSNRKELISTYQYVNVV
jgi:hypothetical protein